MTCLNKKQYKNEYLLSSGLSSFPSSTSTFRPQSLRFFYYLPLRSFSAHPTTYLDIFASLPTFPVRKKAFIPISQSYIFSSLLTILALSSIHRKQLYRYSLARVTCSFASPILTVHSYRSCYSIQAFTSVRHQGLILFAAKPHHRKTFHLLTELTNPHFL